MSVLLNPLDPAFLADPYPVYARLRQEAPVWRHPAGFHAISRYDDVVHVLRNPELFSSRAMGGGANGTGRQAPTQGSVIGLDPPEHTRQRAIVNRGFTPRQISALEPRVRKVAEELFGAFEARGHCDLVASLSAPLPVTVIAELLGLDPSRRDDFKRWSGDLIIGSTSVGSRDKWDSLQASMLEFRAFLLGVIEERREAPGPDLISILIRAEEGEGILSPEQVFGFASLLLAAGSETTTNLIGNAVLALHRNPEQLEALLADRALMPALIEEALRYDPPVQMLMRMTTEDVELGGTTIPANQFVMPLLGSANRDESQFPAPDRFDLGRAAQGHIAFGLGNHFCLGASLARLEASVAFDGVLDRLLDFSVEEDAVERHTSFLIRGPSALPLRFRPPTA